MLSQEAQMTLSRTEV